MGEHSKYLMIDDLSLAHQVGLIGVRDVPHTRFVMNSMIIFLRYYKWIDVYAVMTTNVIVYFLGGAIYMSPDEVSNVVGELISFRNNVYGNTNTGDTDGELSPEDFSEVMASVRSVIVECLMTRKLGYRNVFHEVRKMLYLKTEVLKRILGELVPDTLTFLRYNILNGYVDKDFLDSTLSSLEDIHNRAVETAIDSDDMFEIDDVVEVIPPPGEVVSEGIIRMLETSFKIVLINTAIFHAVNFCGAVVTESDCVFMRDMFLGLQHG